MPKREYTPPNFRGLESPGTWPKISIVTAVRNGAKYLDATIRSVTTRESVGVRALAAGAPAAHETRSNQPLQECAG